MCAMTHMVTTEIVFCVACLCRVCWAAMPTKHAASAQKLAYRFTDLLDVAVTENDGLP